MEKEPKPFSEEKAKEIMEAEGLGERSQMAHIEENMTKMGDEQKQESKEYHKRLLLRAIGDEVERLSEEGRPRLQKQMERVLQHDALTEERIRKVVHEYKKIKELELLSKFGLIGNQENHAGGAWRGKQALKAFDVSDSFSYDIDDSVKSVLTTHICRFVN